jgi:hypothetical protein
MKNLFKAAALAVALMTTAPAVANATAFITIDPPAANGSLSGVYGNTGIGAGLFTDVIPFTLPTGGLTSATITSILTSLTNNVNLIDVQLNGMSFMVGSTGNVEFRFLENLATLSGPQTLTIFGESFGEGSYGGTVAFSPAAVPEPAAWAMMILGFGLVGVGMRLTRRSGVAGVAA